MSHLAQQAQEAAAQKRSTLHLSLAAHAPRGGGRFTNCGLRFGLDSGIWWNGTRILNNGVSPLVNATIGFGSQTVSNGSGGYTPGLALYENLNYKIIFDEAGNVVAGYHRVIAGHNAAVAIPESAIHRIKGVTERPVQNWDDVIPDS